MEREFVLGSTSCGLEYALAGDRHYDGMRAPDGADISTRSKHREYMKRHGLTTADDFKKEWTSAQTEREQRRTGTYEDRKLRQHLERELHRRT